jgi:ABC-2 type transport system permease protein
MRAFDLAAKDLKQLLRDWRTALFLLAMPLAMTLLMGFAFGGFGGGEKDPRLPVGVLNQDGSGPAGRYLLELLGASAVVRPETLKASEQDALDKKVREGDLAAVVVVPAGYGEALLSGTPLPLRVVVDPGSSGGLTAQTEIQAAAGRLAGSAEAARIAAQMLEEQAKAHPETVSGWAGPQDRQQFLEASLEQALQEWKQVAIAVKVSESGAIAQEDSPRQGGFLHTSPSMMVQFAIAGLIGAATMLVTERKSRSLRRLLTTPISRAEILLGHYLAMVVLILFQLAVLVAFGQIVLGVPYLSQPVAVLLVMFATALWTAALGLLIGALAKSEEQVVLFSLIPMFVLAGMGGAWVPLEYTGKVFQTIGHLLPTAWAMDGFENIVIRGLGLQSVLLPVGIMLAYAVALFGLAAWLFRTE